MDTNPARAAVAASLILPDLDPAVAEALAARAARHGRSPEAEAAAILRAAVAPEPPPAPRGAPKTGEELVAAILARFGPAHGFDFERPPQEMIGEPRVRFD